MTEQPSAEKSGRVPRWWNQLIVLIAVFCVIGLCLILSSDWAKEYFYDIMNDPRRQSINNLKNITLAQKNYASQSSGSFAVPTLFNDAGDPLHGWFTQLLPLTDNGSLYDRIDLTVPWHDPSNREHFKHILRYAQIPDFEPKLTATGYPTIHYTLNSRLFPGDVSLTEDEISRADGLANTILMGEIEQNLPSWGAPGNARDPALGLMPGPDTMGVSVHSGMTFIGFADGRVVPVSNKINPAILRAISTPDGGEPDHEWSE